MGNQLVQQIKRKIRKYLNYLETQMKINKLTKKDITKKSITI